MKILDCESIDSPFASVEEILRIDRSLLERTLGDLDLEEECSRAGGRTAAEVLLDAAMKHGEAAEPVFDRTCWFHFTRTHPRNTFSRGLLPLKEAMPFLWGLLLMLLPEDFPLEAWYRFAENLPSGPFRNRLADPSIQGPFAVLPREAGFCGGDSGVRDSLETPEIVEDICAVIQAEHGVDLLPAYRKNTRPCIVKFLDNEPTPLHLGIALQYLYSVLKGGQIPVGCRADFDAGGRGIPPDEVLDVTFL